MDILVLTEVIIAGGELGKRPDIDALTSDGYWKICRDILSRPLPAEQANRSSLLKGLVLLENDLHLGSTSQIWHFMNRLDLNGDDELMNWMLSHRKNGYIPFGSAVPLETTSLKEYRAWETAREAHRQKMLEADRKLSRAAAVKRMRRRIKHAWVRQEKSDSRAKLIDQVKSEQRAMQEKLSKSVILKIVSSNVNINALPESWATFDLETCAHMSKPLIHSLYLKLRTAKKGPWRRLKINMLNSFPTIRMDVMKSDFDKS